MISILIFFLICPIKLMSLDTEAREMELIRVCKGI